LRRIVDEFSKFARMPEPDRKTHDLAKLVSDAVVLQRLGQPDVDIKLAGIDDALMVEFDDTMISQAMTNLIKNAGEAIESLIKKGAPDNLVPQIVVEVAKVEGQACITIADNGIGLPEDRARLFEPYVTTRTEGTGLGLPIVKKIIEEHGGALQLHDAPVFDGQNHFGAMAVVKMPLSPTDLLAANNK
jgi:two-component system nitrogen regulation sensor histidine kinase NtrY